MGTPAVSVGVRGRWLARGLECFVKARVRVRLRLPGGSHTHTHAHLCPEGVVTKVEGRQGRVRVEAPPNRRRARVGHLSDKVRVRARARERVRVRVRGTSES